MSTFNDYLSSIKIVEQKNRMAEILRWIEENFPNLETVIKWNQPMFVNNGTFIIGFSIAKNHIAFSPEEFTINIFVNDILESGYEHTKRLVRIKWTDDIDYSLIKRIIEFNINDKKKCTTFFRS